MQPAQRYSTALDILDITPEAVAERLSYRLQHMVGTGRRWSYRTVSIRSGIDVRTLKAYVQGTACPSLVKYKLLLAVLGPEIGIELNAMKGWLPRSAVMPPEALDLAELRRELDQASDIVGEVLEHDGSPVDRGEWAPEGEDENLDLADGGALDDPVHAEPATTLPEFVRPLKIEEIDTHAVAARLSYRLRRIIGPGRPWQIAEVSERTGIDRRTLQSYLDGTACPNLARFLRLGYLLGTEIGVELAHMIGWEPRHGASAPLRRDEVQALYHALHEARSAVQRILVHGPAGEAGPRLIRRGDRIEDGSDQASDRSVIPLAVHR